MNTVDHSHPVEPYKVTLPQALSMLRHEHLHVPQAEMDRIRAHRQLRLAEATDANRDRLHHVMDHDLAYEPDSAVIAQVSHHGSQTAAEIVQQLQSMGPRERAEAERTIATITNRQYITKEQTYTLVIGEEAEALEPTADQVRRFEVAASELLENGGIPEDISKNHRLKGTTMEMLLIELRALPTQRRNKVIADLEAASELAKNVMPMPHHAELETSVA